MPSTRWGMRPRRMGGPQTSGRFPDARARLASRVRNDISATEACPVHPDAATALVGAECRRRGTGATEEPKREAPQA